MKNYFNFSQSYNDVIENGYFILPTIIEIEGVKQLSKENFGPILHIVRYKQSKIDLIIDDINNTKYGLTFGVHSRNQHFCEDIAKRISSGNIYINRNMTGARVGVQPFGGKHLSGTGPKAGGPNYLKKFLTEKVTAQNISAIGVVTDLIK